MEKHIITNDLKLDSIKDNFKPPAMTEIRDDAVEHLLQLLKRDFGEFQQYVYKNSEYYTDKGHKFYNTTDVAKFIVNYSSDK